MKCVASGRNLYGVEAALYSGRPNTDNVTLYSERIRIMGNPIICNGYSFSPNIRLMPSGISATQAVNKGQGTTLC